MHADEVKTDEASIAAALADPSQDWSRVADDPDFLLMNGDENVSESIERSAWEIPWQTSLLILLFRASPTFNGSDNNTRNAICRPSPTPTTNSWTRFCPAGRFT